MLICHIIQKDMEEKVASSLTYLLFSPNSCLFWVMLLTLRSVSIQGFLCFCIPIHVYSFFVFTKMEPYHTCCSRTHYVLEFFLFQGKERSLALFNGSIVFHNANNLHLFNLLPTDSISECFQFLLQWYHRAQTPWPHRRSPDTWVVKAEAKWKYDRSGMAEVCPGTTISCPGRLWPQI